MGEKEKGEREFTAVFLKRAGWYVAYIEELPGVNTQGRTLEEARENLKEALLLILQANRELASEFAPEEAVIRERLRVRVEG